MKLASIGTTTYNVEDIEKFQRHYLSWKSRILLVLAYECLEIEILSPSSPKCQIAAVE